MNGVDAAMMGHGHALTGAAAYLAVTSTSHLALGLAPQSPSVMALGATLTAGAALLPDLDHHSGTIAHAVPPLKIAGHTIIPSPTQALAVLVERVSGGHRHLTHSLLGVLAAALIGLVLACIRVPATWVTALLGKTGVHINPESISGGYGVNIGTGLACILLIAFACKALHLTSVSGNSAAAIFLRSWLGPWIAGTLVGVWAMIFAPVNWLIMLPVVMGGGAFVHCLGDTLTTQGVAWFQPWQGPAPEKVRNAAKHGNPLAKAITWCWPPNGYLRFPILGTAGSWRESLFSLALTVYCLYLIMHAMVAAWVPNPPTWLL